MKPVSHPWDFASGRLTLGDFICVMDRNRINSTAVNVELLSKILHAHCRTFYMPAWIAFAPWRIPHHFLLAELASGEPQNEIKRVPLVGIHIGSCTALES